MRIGVNLLAFQPDRMGGLEHYVRRLLAALVDQAADEFVLFLPPGGEAAFEEVPGRLRVRAFALDGGDIPLALALVDERLDLWWCPWVVWRPLHPPVPAVVTIPDLQHEHLPDSFTPEEWRHRRVDYFVAAHCARAAITFSNHTRADLIQSYGVPEERVFAVPLDVGYDWSATEPSAEMLDELRAKVGSGFLFYPANGWPHKDHATLLRALRQRADAGQGDRLVLTGAGVQGRAEIEAAIRDEGLAAAVHLLGTVTPAEVRGLYRLSSAVVFPSRFEGFGLPLLEAMRSGVPVLSSDATSLPEVGADAVSYFRAGDAADLAQKIGAITGDESLRARLVERGTARAATFSWLATARSTRAAFAFAQRSEAARNPVATALGALADRLRGMEAAARASEADREARGDVIVRMAARIREVHSVLEEARPKAFHGLVSRGEVRRVRGMIDRAAHMLRDLLY